MNTDTSFIQLNVHERAVLIEYRWIARNSPAAPVIVFLHEGLGSAAMWKDFPDRLCAATGARGLVYSRPGYGRSRLPPAGPPWGMDFMHRQAHELLPALLRELGVDAAPWLFGHSDGASIALLHAARHRVRGVMAVAPHIFVEELTIHGIAQARAAFETGDLRKRLAPYHDDVDAVFRRWRQIWLAPAFRRWSIERDIRVLTTPVLAIQGEDDEYGSLAQIRGIAHRLPHARTLEIAGCGHFPHRDRPELLIQACRDFLHSHEKAPHHPTH